MWERARRMSGRLKAGGRGILFPILRGRNFFTGWSGLEKNCGGEIVEAVGDLAEVEFTREAPFMRMHTIDGLPTMVAAFTTDVPSLTNWGKPLLVGPGSIHVAHTEGEFIEKAQLSEAVELYCAIAKRLIS